MTTLPWLCAYYELLEAWGVTLDYDDAHTAPIGSVAAEIVAGVNDETGTCLAVMTE